MFFNKVNVFKFLKDIFYILLTVLQNSFTK